MEYDEQREPQDAIIFKLPIPPTAKGRPRLGKHGSVYTPKKTKEFERVFRQLAMRWKPDEPFDCPLQLTLQFRLNLPKTQKHDEPITRPDLDNYIKAVMDAMVDFWVDDSRVCDIRARKAYAESGDGAHIWVCLKPL